MLTIPQLIAVCRQRATTRRVEGGPKTCKLGAARGLRAGREGWFDVRGEKVGKVVLSGRRDGDEGGNFGHEFEVRCCELIVVTVMYCSVLSVPNDFTVWSLYWYWLFIQVASIKWIGWYSGTLDFSLRGKTIR